MGTSYSLLVMEDVMMATINHMMGVTQTVILNMAIPVQLLELANILVLNSVEMVQTMANMHVMMEIF
jgi:hypothetical protein